MDTMEPVTSDRIREYGGSAAPREGWHGTASSLLGGTASTPAPPWQERPGPYNRHGLSRAVTPEGREPVS